MLSRYWLRGRRRGGRRSGEIRDIYVDRYTPREWGLMVTLVALTLVDWLWTLAHVARGTGEANPLLAWLLAAGGPVAFSAAKLGVTALAAGFLLFHVRFRYARVLLPAAVGVYLAVLGVHVGTEILTTA